MKVSNEPNDKQVKIEKNYILEMLRENECETLEELKNLIIFLNSENKRLHSINMESLKKINILSVRVKHLENLTKDYDRFYQNKISYNRKFKELKNKVNMLVRFAKDKENEYNELIGKQDKYFKNFFFDLNKTIESIISCDKDNGCSTPGRTSPNVSSIKYKEKVHSNSHLKHQAFPLSFSNTSFYGNNNNRVCSANEDGVNENSISEDGFNDEGDKDLKIEKKKDEVSSTRHGLGVKNVIPNALKLQKELSSKNYILSPKNSGKKCDYDLCYNRNIEKIKSLCESIKNVDNESSNSKNSYLSKENNFSIYNNHKTELEYSPDDVLCTKFEKKKKYMVSSDKGNIKNTNLIENITSKTINIQDEVELYKTQNGRNLQTQKSLNKIVDYNADIKQRLNNLMDEVSVEDNKKNSIITKNYLNKGIISKSNITGILTNKANIASLEHIENSIPKYVKYNTIHREIMNPRQHFLTQNKSSIDHIICL
ncbi:conserved Plasmodium protein, unknown function [Plasmodium malariae]|uniref:Uncharacterized protein n=1 Tax=Plasmodium malariae TaxID=5858 RepID=A0A1A8VZA1_PLAMA|nr:conserved Plasmodium protein, unknown function [Plasmodium malariae]SBS85819.1 conserved Plasmodium protein, unknown function [Plasmodium malariae]SCN12894.1 conserved Plasmodium protein, unknown function [Plasmodium malariae]